MESKKWEISVFLEGCVGRELPTIDNGMGEINRGGDGSSDCRLAENGVYFAQNYRPQLCLKLQRFRYLNWQKRKMSHIGMTPHLENFLLHPCTTFVAMKLGTRLERMGGNMGNEGGIMREDFFAVVGS